MTSVDLVHLFAMLLIFAIAFVLEKYFTGPLHFQHGLIFLLAQSLPVMIRQQPMAASADQYGILSGAV